jgi:hypothetical protein
MSVDNLDLRWGVYCNHTGTDLEDESTMVMIDFNNWLVEQRILFDSQDVFVFGQGELEEQFNSWLQIRYLR